jgi:hypothetical protein
MTLFCLSPISFAEDAQNPPEETWGKGGRENKGAWDSQKQWYQNVMANYYYSVYEYQLFDTRVTNLTNRATFLQQEVDKPKSKRLFGATSDSWDANVDKLKAELIETNKQIKEMTETRQSLSDVMKAIDPKKIKEKLDDSAITAFENANVNHKKKNFLSASKPVLKETTQNGVSIKTLNQLQSEADERARAAFTEKYPEAPTPASARFFQPTPPVVNQNAVVENLVPVESEKAKVAPLVVEEKKVIPIIPVAVVEKAKAANEPLEQKGVPVVSLKNKDVAQGSPSEKECDKAKAEIVRALLAKGKRPKAFSEMIYLAQLKMAYRLADQKPPKTLEDFVKNAGLQAQIKGAMAGDTSEFKKSITDLYTKYGMAQDLNQISLFSEKGPHYKKVRLNNDSASAVILHLSQTEKNPVLPFNQTDAAAVWAMQKIIKDNGYKVGDGDYNMLSFNTRLCRFFKDSSCTDGKNKELRTTEKLKSKFDEENSAFEKAIQSAGTEMIKAYPQCFNTDVCDTPKPLTLGDADLESIKGKLAELVGKGSLDGIESKVEVDPSKTTGKDGNLTIYLKTK